MLYHYTSAKLLEKIIGSRKLRPSGVRGWRLLWATAVPTVDLTSAYHHEPIIARFTLHSCDFEPWTEVRARYQQEEMRERAERMEQRALNEYGGYGTRPENWFVRYASLPADRWLRIDTRDQRWQPYGSSTWRQQGPPQLGMMPWLSEYDYKELGIDLGEDPETMDAAAYADYCYRIKEEQDDQDWRRTHKEEEDWEEEEDCEEEEEDREEVE